MANLLNLREAQHGVHLHRGTTTAWASKQHVQDLEQRLRKMEAMMQQQQHQQQQQQGTGRGEASLTPRSRESSTSTGQETSRRELVPDPDLRVSDPDSGAATRTDRGDAVDRRIRHTAGLLDPVLSAVSFSPPQPAPKPALDKIRDRLRGSMHLPNFMAKSLERLYSSNEIAWFVAPLLDEINAQFPVLDVDRLVRRIEDMTTSPDRSAAWTTIIESIMARVVLVRAAADGVRRCYDMAWDQMSTSLERLSSLLLDADADANGDVVDALLSMVLFTRGTADTRTTAMLVRSALQSRWVASKSDPAPSAVADDKTRDLATRKIWALYAIDQELSLTHGMPPSIRELDIDQTIYPLDTRASTDAPVPVKSRPQGHFWARVRLATITAEIHARLYSPRAAASSRGQSAGAILACATDLHAVLRNLTLSICPATAFAAQQLPGSMGGFLGVDLALPLADVSVVSLHFGFCNAGSMIYHAVLRAENTPPIARENARAYCLAAARSTLSALQSWPPATLPELWQLLAYPLAAALTILEALLIHQYGEEDPGEDAKIIAQLGQYLRQTAMVKGFPLDSLIAGCDEMARLAQIAAHSPTHRFMDMVIMTTVRDLLSQATSPIYIAQGLIGNLPTPDSRISRELAKHLLCSELVAEMPAHRAPFAPDILHHHAMRPKKA
ncbi:uncharacterized protein B0I36DRAFT_367257 [Microdochium trichocladiopsis]|uniref:Transcription factor domain-containing protein n=1 Tax=Microdochium trichocladiopsis TaxID=1682393 RepID=A0A9P9BK17_9PEZI|nr:uncharacterized protein B0I36DRAFT_367257 [Microdochium trichocladiopsis]KAH7020774.1 hypothetical protein B0I36DRAFT_367257 [Microdochium trichocladiopsis]